MSQWIWKFGEFECYHNLLLHNRRTEYGYAEPPVWKVYAPETIVQFKKVFTTEGGDVFVKALGEHSITLVGEHPWENVKLKGAQHFHLDAGTHTLVIRVSSPHAFPALYVDGIVESDESWLADDFTDDYRPVGTWSALNDPNTTPDVFPFVYEEVKPVSKEVGEDGVIYDYGKEIFGRIHLSKNHDEKVTVRPGESKEETMDPVWCVIRFDFTEREYDYQASAFRYMYVSDPNTTVTVETEGNTIATRGNFACSDELLNRIYDTAAYTFELNSREFFLDGIKRDRWVWSGDSYQSVLVNHYFSDNREIEKRTLTSLGRKSPIKTHINGIVDYSFLWVMAVYEYYSQYGDIKYLDDIYPMVKELVHFFRNRVDEDGFVRGIEGDWIFIDWAPMDKTGALLGEQVLYAKALEVYAQISSLLGKDDEGSLQEAQTLQKKIPEYFYDETQGVFIDSYESGKHSVTRHNNILAYLYLPIGDEIKHSIYRNVICNDEVPAITTPYFKFFENLVCVKEGDEKRTVESIREYYGAMLEFGATTFFERFDPEEHGVEHYAMYGHPYEGSLCHAWSSCPVYFLAGYILGVRKKDVGWKTYTVEPKLLDLEYVKGSVPVPGGVVTVDARKDRITVTSDIEGGTLIWNGKEYPIKAGETLACER